ncbi:MAG: tetraacyldisaccharide 4'-kinase [Acidobacteriota bacterium]|nr:tetraacyldisaccharide 4'-kinase [Acidobacteriota bacterium]
MRPLAALYDRLLEARARRYASGGLPSERLSRPVVSVGNLTVGGTGKTPFVLHLAERFLSQGRRPAILSRGYGRRSREVVVVSRGEGPIVGADLGGDEPVLIAERLPRAIVVVAPLRADAARAAEELAPDVFILDDGFQHMAVRRDVDLLLLDAADPFGGERYPPFGRLREPPSALGRADGVVFTRPSEGHPTSSDLSRIARANPEAPVFHARIFPQELTKASGGPADTPARCVAVCGIASPASFLASLAALGIEPAETIVFPDHRRYGERDVARISAAARRSTSTAVVTTEKDAVKLGGLIPLPLVMVRLGVEMTSPGFYPWMEGRLFGGLPNAAGGEPGT